MTDANHNQDPFSQPPTVGTEEKIPHGKEPLRRVFDKNEDIRDFHNPDAPDFDVPASPALTPAERELGLELPTTTAKTTEKTSPVPKKSKRTAVIAGAAGLAGIGLTAGIFTAAGGSDSEPRADQAPAATAEPFEETPVATDPGAPVIIETPATVNAPEATSAPAPTAVNTPEVTAAPTTANAPEASPTTTAPAQAEEAPVTGILTPSPVMAEGAREGGTYEAIPTLTGSDLETTAAQIMNNIECAANSTDAVIREKCMEYLVEGYDNELFNVFYQIAARTENTRLDNPGFRTGYNYELLPEESGMQDKWLHPIISVRYETVEQGGPNGDATYNGGYMRLTLEVKRVIIGGNPGDTMIWTIRSMENFNTLEQLQNSPILGNQETLN